MESENMINKLKPLPCPFCGSPAHVETDGLISDAFAVYCEDGHSNGCASHTKEAAIMEWNRRAPQETKQ